MTLRAENEAMHTTDEGPVEDDAVAGVARALAHPARVRILRLLLERDNCIGCDIVDEIGLAQSTVSQHLSVLRDAGVVIGRTERPRVCYSLNPDRLAPLARMLNAILGPDAATGGICCPGNAAPSTASTGQD